MAKKRRYNEDYLKFGFTYCIDKDGMEKPQCFICARVLCNENMRPNKLHEHFIRMHPGNSEESLEILKQRKARFHSSIPESGNNNFGSNNNNLNSELGLVSGKKSVLETSYKIAYIIAKNKMPHTVAEKIIKPCALEMVEDVLGNQHRKQIAEIPMSKDVISSRIRDMASDVLEQLVEELQKTNLPFGIQLDESTDEPECSQLLVFVRYVTNMCIKDEFLFSEPLSNTTKPCHVLHLIDEFFSKNSFDWKTKLGFICTDGASSVLGKESGFGELAKVEAPKVVLLHCFPHQHALASKTLPPRLKSALNTVTQSVNCIRSCASNHEIFKTLFQEVGSDQEAVLCNTETRWLSHGRVLNRVMELKPEIAAFLRDKDHKLYGELETENLSWSLAYLADVFSHLNDLNVSVQGPEVSVVDASEKVAAFKQKLELWKRRLAKRNYTNFPTLEKLLSTDVNFSQKFAEWIQGDISNHMDHLVNYLDEYSVIQKELRNDGWIRNPFTFNLDTMDDADMQKDDLIDLQSKALLMQNFFIQNLDEFWCSQMVAYPALAKKAILSLIPSATTYLCQSGFLTLISIKTKSGNRSDARHDMRLALSKIIPRITGLANKKQHPSD